MAPHSPLRILCVGNIFPPHDFRGGYELTWASSVGHLRDRGDRVRVLASEHRSAGVDVEEDEVFRDLRWYWRDHEFPRLGWRERIALERHNQAQLERHLNEFAPYAVAWWGMGGMSLGLVEAVRRAGLPAVGVVGDEWMVWGPRADRWQATFRRRPRAALIAERLTGLPARLELGAAATWLFNSEIVRERSAAAGWKLERPEVAHPGIDDTLFAARDAPPWRWQLLYVGRMDARKGVHVAIDALALLPPEAELTVQGSGDESYAAGLRERAESLGVSGRVRFASAPREELADVYAAADAVLFPVQWEEPWGLVPLEAMAVGRPVIASGTGGSREYLRDGENALVYAPRESAEGLAEAVRRLAADPSLRERLVAGGRPVAARYTEARYNAAIAEAIDHAAALTRGG